MCPPGSRNPRVIQDALEGRTRLRLVKVIVHPIFLVDDGESLTEFENQPSVVLAADWEAFPERLKTDIAEVEAQLNASD